MMRNTKNYSMRHRLNREVSHSEDFTKRFLTNEYGNYDKYEKNKIDLKYKEDGLKEDKDMIYENYLEMLKKLPTKERQRKENKKREDIENMLTNQEYAHEQFAENYLAWKADESLHTIDDARAKTEQEMYDDPVDFEDHYYGRMSPFSKEMLFREYLKGKTVKDLSLKYGILQQRVKAIVYQKYLYWNEVYPRMGETHMRLAIEREAIYASNFPFIEYG